VDRMSRLDAGFLELEDADPNESLAIASVASFEGAAPSYEEFAATIASRLPLVRRYRQKVRRIPFDLGETVTSIARYEPFLLTPWPTRLAFKLPQRNITTFTTNVPGPRLPLYALGRRVEEIFPYVPIATTLRFGVSIFSLAGQMTFGITGDRDTTSDIDVFARGIGDTLAELVEATQRDADSRPAVAIAGTG
jgi:diacylglycerol O-acyltransferase / wax synthase